MDLAAAFWVAAGICGRVQGLAGAEFRLQEGSTTALNGGYMALLRERIGSRRKASRNGPQV